jgi:hypothetical protein
MVMPYSVIHFDLPFLVTTKVVSNTCLLKKSLLLLSFIQVTDV